MTSLKGLNEKLQDKHNVSLCFSISWFYNVPVWLSAAFLAQSVCLDDTTVKFEIWDTAGQERYHSLAPMYYRGAQAAIVVFDITKPVNSRDWDAECTAPNCASALSCTALLKDCYCMTVSANINEHCSCIKLISDLVWHVSIVFLFNFTPMYISVLLFLHCTHSLFPFLFHIHSLRCHSFLPLYTFSPSLCTCSLGRRRLSGPKPGWRSCRGRPAPTSSSPWRETRPTWRTSVWWNMRYSVQPDYAYAHMHCGSRSHHMCSRQWIFSYRISEAWAIDP